MINEIKEGDFFLKGRDVLCLVKGIIKEEDGSEFADVLEFEKDAGYLRTDCISTVFLYEKPFLGNICDSL